MGTTVFGMALVLLSPSGSAAVRGIVDLSQPAPVASSTAAARCEPVPPSAQVLAVVTAGMPELSPLTVLARAVIAGSAPFELASEARTREALTAERGLGARQSKVREARALLERAELAFSELEDRDALTLVAEATPLLVAAQAESEAVELLARAHLLAGAIFAARDRLDAASRRLQRALDIDPDIAPDANLRLLGALEVVRARSGQRARGWLEVELTGTATSAEVFLDGRRIGRAPGRFEDLPEGRHLIRISAPGYESYAGTIAIDQGIGTVLRTHLARDPVLARFRDLGERLAAGADVQEAQERLTRRAKVDRTLVAALAPSVVRDPAGELEAGLILDLERAGRARVEDLSPASVRSALVALARCREDRPPAEPTMPAPAIPGARAAVRPSPPKGPEPPPPLFKSPWFWLAAATLTLGLAGGLAAAHGASAPPDSLSITLIPRP